MEKLKLKKAIVAEGKYDKIKLASIADGVILTTNGFGIFKSKELRQLVRFYAEKTGIVVLTDSDGAGRRIRAHIKSIVPKEYHDNIINLHIPQIKGKERRKAAPSKEGTLGVEGMDSGLLRDMLIKCGACDSSENAVYTEPVTKNDMYMLGISGGADAAKKRELLAKRLELPQGLSSSALLDAINILCGREELERICSELWDRRRQ